MIYLLDTNVVSEVRKGSRAAPRVMEWYRRLPEESVRLSVATLAEIRRGIERVRHSDSPKALVLERWLEELKLAYGPRIIPITVEVADVWGRLCPHQQLPAQDAYLAATALVHGMTIATRNTADFLRSGALLFDPFKD